MSVSDRAEAFLKRLEEVLGPIDPMKRNSCLILLIGAIGDERIDATAAVASALVRQLESQVNREGITQ